MDESPLDQDHEAVEGQPNDPERGEGDEHERGVEQPLVGDVDEHAKARAGADPLGDAPRDRSISRSSGSAERMPTMVAMAIGKKTINAQTRTRANRPPPNQMSSSGASARTGTACAATM
jgi:hypothetical protein